jgi:mRNA interferase HigB
VISYKAIREYKAKHADSGTSLDYWFRVTNTARWNNFADLKQVFGTADFVAPFVVFNIGGNKYRLIARINFLSKTVFIRHILTHKEYDQGKWRT